eukprot:6486567-Amphidinium_carterae.1
MQSSSMLSELVDRFDPGRVGRVGEQGSFRLYWGPFVNGGYLQRTFQGNGDDDERATKSRRQQDLCWGSAQVIQ